MLLRRSCGAWRGWFMALLGVDSDGTGRFVDDLVPTRSEKVQADYVGEQLELLHGAGVDGVFIYVFSFPAYPAGEGAKALDMVSFSLVKTYPSHDPRASQMPPWAPKESFWRVANFYKTLQGNSSIRRVGPPHSPGCSWR